MHRLFASLVIGCIAVTSLLAQGGIAGKWEGATVTGRPITLELKVKGTDLTGTLTLAGQSAPITDGKVDGKTCSFRATIEDRSPQFSGRLVGEDLELTVEGVANPVTLKRAK
jgi:hypothetical protein